MKVAELQGAVRPVKCNGRPVRHAFGVGRGPCAEMWQKKGRFDGI